MASISARIVSENLKKDGRRRYKKFLMDFHLKEGLGMEFTAYEREIMKDVALTSFTSYDAYLSFAAHGKFPGGPLPNYKILKLQISANSFDTKRVTWQCQCKRMYLLEGTSHCATHYGKNLALFRVNRKDNLKMNQTLPRTYRLTT